MTMAVIVQMCGGSHKAALKIVVLMRRKGMKKEARTLALRGAAAMGVAAIEQMSGGSIEWHFS